MKKTIIISIAIGAIGMLAYFIYPIVTNRYFPKTKTTSEEISSSLVSPQNNDSSSIAKSTPPNDSQMNSNPPSPEEQAANEKNMMPSPDKIAKNSTDDPMKKSIETKGNVKSIIASAHCDSKCEFFTNDVEIFEYCNQACGISPVMQVSNCDRKKDLEKDYCQKDLAITKTDASLCEAIEDDNIRKICQNRIAEDAVEKMQSGTQE